MSAPTLPILTRAPPAFPRRRPDAIAAVTRLLERGEWTRLEGVPELERDLESWHGPGADGRSTTAWYVSSGTAALIAMLLAYDLGEGDEIITTPYTWGATVSAVLAVGAIPVFADIDAQTGLIDPASVAARITPRTRAILGVHLFGAPCDAPALRRLADAHRLLFFEDGSQAHGARIAGYRVGAFGDAAAFSCMGLKLLAGTEGGYALFRDAAAAERAYLYGRHPRGLAADRAAALGEEGLLDALQLGWRPCVVGAELVRHALPHLDADNAARRRNAARLRDGLRDCAGVTMPPEPAGSECCWHLLSLIHHPERTGRSRAEFAAALHAAGAGNFHYIPTPIHRLRRLDPATYARPGAPAPRVLWHGHLRRAGYVPAACPQADWRAAREVTLGFNWIDDDAEAMTQLAAAIRYAAYGEHVRGLGRIAP